MKKRILIKAFRILMAGTMLLNLGCAAAVGSAVGYGIGTITGGLEAGKGTDTAVDCPSCIKVQNMEEARRIRENMMRDAYIDRAPRQPAPQQQKP